MNNADVKRMLDDCASDLAKVQQLYAIVGPTHAAAPYLTRYALVRACGVIEVAYKTIIADFCSALASPQVKTFINKMVRKSSRNPRYAHMCQLLGEFDASWRMQLKSRVEGRADRTALLLGLQSLVDARNEFAHGGAPNLALGDVVNYFTSARAIVEEVDLVVR